MSTIDEVHVPSHPPREDRHVGGWVVFAAVVLMILGSLDALYGLAAILNDEIVVVGGQGVILADITTWGWIHLILGSVLAATGLGLLAGMGVARWAAIFFVTVSAVSQIAWFPAAPLWACLMIALSVIVIYQLSMHWNE